MKIIVNVCVLVMSLFLIVAVLGCGSEEDPVAGEPVIGIVGKPVVADPKELVVVVIREPIVMEEQPVHKVIDGILERGSRVEVTNTIVNGVDQRLSIREPAGIDSPIIGSAAEGTTGTILEGPSLGDGWTWWEIAWDDNGKVAFDEGHKCCIGWSAETNFAQDVRYLTEMR